MSRRLPVTLVVFVGAMVLIGALSLRVDRDLSGYRRASPFQAGVPPTGGEWYLMKDGDVVDHDAIYGGWWDIPRHLQAADVIFFGNSRSLYGMRPEVLQPWLDRAGLKGYNLAFYRGTFEFALALIRKWDLHPRFAVVNADSFFFDNERSSLADATLARSRWESDKYVMSHAIAWDVRRVLHLWVPPWREYLTTIEPNEITYRSARTGALKWAFPAPETPHAFPSEPAPMTAERQKTIAGYTERSRANFLAFTRELASRGTKPVITVVPMQTDDSRHITLALLRSVPDPPPYLDVWPDGLVGVDHTHLNARSAKVYGDALMARFLALVQHAQDP
jgi:hypothetical protein